MLHRLSALLALAGLAACDIAGEAPRAPEAGPAPRPAHGAAPSPAPAGRRDLAARYTDLETELRDQGLLRTAVRPRDAPFTRRQLVEDFVRIALYDEYATEGGRIVARQTPSRLRRWEKPVRIAPIFGETVPASQRTEDRRTIAGYAARLARLTGRRITLAEPDKANFLVYVIGEDARRTLGPELRRRVPGIDARSVRAMTDMPPQTFCLVFAFSRGRASTYSHAVAVIRAEHPDILRRSCFHEEIAQGLGLANDSPDARPSIFNDDEEFALLTHHDALLMRILYDPRLSPGMTPQTARPIVREIAGELMAGES